MKAKEVNTKVAIASGLALQKGFYLFVEPESVEQAVERERLLVHGDPVLLGSGPGSLRYTRLGDRAGMHSAKERAEADKKYTSTVNSGWHLLTFERRDRDSPVPSPWMATGGGGSGNGTGASRSTLAGQWGQRSGAAILSQGLGDDGSEQQKIEKVEEEEEAIRVTGAVSYTCLKLYKGEHILSSLILYLTILTRMKDLPLQRIGVPEVGEKSPFLISSIHTGTDMIRCLASLPLPIKGYAKNPMACRMPIWELNVGVSCRCRDLYLSS